MTHLFSLNIVPGALKTSLLALSLSPPPFLQITNPGGRVQIYWPATAIGYTLESATTLGPQGSWIPTTNSAGVVGDRNIVNFIPAGQPVFYRLKQ